MDIQSFIQSGLLEAYALGQCTAEERVLVERMLAEHAEARAELAGIEQALEAYAAANAVAPPDWMKGRILDTLEQQTPAGTPPAPRTGTLRLFQVLALAFALAGGWYFFNSQRQNAEIAELESDAAELQQQVDDCNRRTRQAEILKQAVNLIRDRDTRAVPLSNDKATAYAYYNPVRREVALDLSGLQAPAPGKYFQFWAIVGGKPVNMGMVDLRAADGWQMLPFQQDAVALAISEENNPNGNPTPTTVVMVGNI